VLVKLMGGLGNQMFQYAFGRSVALRRNEGVCFTRDEGDWGGRRCYALGVFGVPIEFASRKGMPVYREGPFSLNPQVYTAPEGMFFDGYWQTEKYFDEPLVRSFFSPRRPMGSASEAVAEEIDAAGGRSAFLHVCRTDYIGQEDYHPNLTLSGYYPRAVALVRERVEDARLFVFSDDPEWCRRAFPRMRVVGHNRPGGRLFGTEAPGTEHEDIWLMSLCRHAVAANSTFSWWGAWLGDTQAGRTVVAPRVWFGPAAGLDTRDLLPDRWLVV